ncbi:MAG: metallophosphoesterase family protein [Methylocystaceae bacterium]
MKIAIAGDTHGEIRLLLRVLREVVKPAMLLFTGDHYRDGIKLGEVLRIPVKAVVGNCDHRQEGAGEELLTIEGHRILLVHGHQYKVKTSMLPLKLRAAEVKAEMVCFGHTHQGGYELVDNIWFVNPGSPTHPRAVEPSLAIVEIDAKQMQPFLLKL